MGDNPSRLEQIEPSHNFSLKNILLIHLQKSVDSLATKPLTVVGQPQSSPAVSKVQLVRVVSTTATTSQPTTSISSSVRPIAPATQQIHVRKNGQL